MSINTNNIESKIQELTTQALVEKIATLEYHIAQLSARLTVVGERLKGYENSENIQNQETIKPSE